MSSEPAPEAPLWNPYVGGFALGLVLLGSYLVMGWGLGSSSGLTRFGYAAAQVVAPEAVANNGYMATMTGSGFETLEDWMVFEVIGVFLGGLIGAYSSGRLARNDLISGPRVDPVARMAMAVTGGMIMGFAARLARGCTSGQALTGGALLGGGSWVFMLAVFAGAYAMAPIVRRAWR